MYKEYKKKVDKLYFLIFTGEFKLNFYFFLTIILEFVKFFTLLMKNRKSIRMNSENSKSVSRFQDQYYNLRISEIQNLNRISKFELLHN